LSNVIAITGKGGVGKITIAGLLIQRLINHHYTPVLAVDADPNTCLDAVLGIQAEKTVGKVREEAREISGQGMTGGIAKQHLLEMKIAETLVESKDFDFIAMGRPEGPGCYCYANNVLKSVLAEISSQYPYIVLDNEAGLENLSRRIVQKVDLLVMVTDPSLRGLETVRRLHALAVEMKLDYHRLAIIINRLRREELPAGVEQLKKDTQADIVLGIPDNDQLAEYGESGKNLLLVPNENPAAQCLDSLLPPVKVT
jgi:CO dehydrogenase maturation factor